MGNYCVTNGDGTTARMGLTKEQGQRLAQQLADETGEPHCLAREGQGDEGEWFKSEHSEETFRDLFASSVEATEFETQALSIGREFLPPCALAVLDGKLATSEYWAWLEGQVETEPCE